MNFYHHLILAGCGLAVLFSGGMAVAQNSKAIAAFETWSAHVIGAKGKRTCYLFGTPTRSTGKYTQRGATYLQVTHRPGENVRDEISVIGGYNFKKDSEVAITIGGKTFTLFTNGSGAWAREARDDRNLVAAMKSGSKMIIKGRSGRGTLTTDTYSLSGFTAAYNALNKGCGIK
jgi:hypothetical protein